MRYCRRCTVLYCTVLYCIVLYCTVLHCVGEGGDDRRGAGPPGQDPHQDQVPATPRHQNLGRGGGGGEGGEARRRQVRSTDTTKIFFPYSKNILYFYILSLFCLFKKIFFVVQKYFVSL